LFPSSKFFLRTNRKRQLLEESWRLGVGMEL
jgi:hypothetical protein